MASSDCVSTSIFSVTSDNLLLNFVPSRQRALLAPRSPMRLRALSSRFSPPHRYRLSSAGTSSLLRTPLPSRTTSSGPRLSPCSSLSASPNSTGLPRLLSRLPGHDHILNHIDSLIRFRAFPLFARLPSAHAVSGSLPLCTVPFLSLPSDPSVTSGALVIRIYFPLIGALPLSFKRPGLPASPGKQK